jgi:hypothetical protein
MSETVCIANIGRRERNTRFKFGVVMLALGIAGAFALVVLDVRRMFRIALFVPFWLAAIGIFQAREKT